MINLKTLTLSIGLLCVPFQAVAWEYLSSLYEHALTYEEALEKISAKEDRYVMVYLYGGPTCGPCHYTQHQLNSGAVVARLKSKVVVVEAFAWGTTIETEKRVVNKFGRRHWNQNENMSFAPVLAIVDRSGQQVIRLVGGLNSTREALVLGEFLDGKHFKRTTLKQFALDTQ